MALLVFTLNRISKIVLFSLYTFLLGLLSFRPAFSIQLFSSSDYYIEVVEPWPFFVFTLGLYRLLLFLLLLFLFIGSCCRSSATLDVDPAWLSALTLQDSV